MQWADALRNRLQAGVVELALTRAGIEAGGAAPVPWGGDAEDVFDADKRATLAQCVQALPASARVRVSVDASWAHVFAVPWMAELDSSSRWQQYAQSSLAQRQGVRADDWEVRVQSAWPPHTRLAAALPRALVDAVGEVCGTRLAGLHVDVLRWFDAVLAQRPHWSGCAVEIDDCQAWIFICERGAPVRVRARRAKTAGALAACMLTEWAAFGDGRAPMAVKVGPRARAAGYGGVAQAQSERESEAS